jgi:hypothetical protein
VLFPLHVNSIISAYTATAGPITPQGSYDAASPRLQGQQHNRFPSFDSVASTGSFQVLSVAPSPDGSLPTPVMLPYAQRRKLQQKRQQQQQQFTQQNASQPQHQEHDTRQNPLSQGKSLTHHLGDAMVAETGHAALTPMDYDQHQQHMQPPQPYPFMHAQGPPHQQQTLPPSGYRPSQGRQAQKLETIQSASSRPPNHRNYGGNARGRTSSADSTSPENERPSPFGTKPSEAAPPPPPPSYHLRTDSAGSISSMGSYGGGPVTVDGFVDHEKGNSTVARGFAGEIMSYLSPKTRPRTYSVEDFHEKNQTFLKNARRHQNSPQQSGSSPRVQRPNLRTDTPPRTRGGHRRLTSIENDEWEEPENRLKPRVQHSRGGHEASSSDVLSSSEISDSTDADERTSLLSPPGISSNEYTEGPRKITSKGKRRSRDQEGSGRYTERREAERPDPILQRGEDPTLRFDNRAAAFGGERTRRKTNHKRKKTRKDDRRRSRRYRQSARSSDSEYSDDSNSSSSENGDYRQKTKKRAQMMEKERAKLIAQWKAEARAEAEQARAHHEKNLWYNRIRQAMEAKFAGQLDKIFRFFALAEIFISNLPSTIGAVALAIVTLGVVWFKYAEENLDSCEPVRFHSSQCTFPEFPGCFYCDTDAIMYKVAVNFHFACSAFAGVLTMLFGLKIVLATRVVLDELSSPTTASPAGLLCMTMVCVFAGRGWIGQVLVAVASAMHLCLAVWFIYCALAYHIMPEPSWFPNTVGIGLSAVKTWLYYPMCGHFLMAVSVSNI